MITNQASWFEKNTAKVVIGTPNIYLDCFVGLLFLLLLLLRESLFGGQPLPSPIRPRHTSLSGKNFWRAKQYLYNMRVTANLLKIIGRLVFVLLCTRPDNIGRALDARDTYIALNTRPTGKARVAV